MYKLIFSCWLLVLGFVDVFERVYEYGIINCDVWLDNIMIVKRELEEIEMFYILDWGYVVIKKKFFCFSGGVMYVLEWILE